MGHDLDAVIDNRRVGGGLDGFIIILFLEQKGMVSGKAGGTKKESNDVTTDYKI